MMPVRHDFSDCPDGGISIQSYSYCEVFAEKIRALKERTRPRDLYDVINFYRRPESREVAGDVKSILAKKCEFKGISLPSLEDLDQHKQICASGWFFDAIDSARHLGVSRARVTQVLARLKE